MTLKRSITVDGMINFLNELLMIDKNAIQGLVNHRIICNDELADHPTVQVLYVKNDDCYKVGLLGILNGLFGIDNDGYGAICINVQDGEIINFARTEDYDKS